MRRAGEAAVKREEQLQRHREQRSRKKLSRNSVAISGRKRPIDLLAKTPRTAWLGFASHAFAAQIGNPLVGVEFVKLTSNAMKGWRADRAAGSCCSPANRWASRVYLLPLKLLRVCSVLADPSAYRVGAARAVV